MTEKQLLTLLGDRIKELRTSKNINKSQLAELIGVQKSQMGKIENAESFITAKTLLNLCIVFNCTPAQLFNFTESL